LFQFLSQHSPEGFVHAVVGDVIPLGDPAGHFIFRQVLAAVGEQFFPVKIRPLLHNDKSDNGFSPYVVREPTTPASLTLPSISLYVISSPLKVVAM